MFSGMGRVVAHIQRNNIYCILFFLILLRTINFGVHSVVTTSYTSSTVEGIETICPNCDFPHPDRERKQKNNNLRGIRNKVQCSVAEHIRHGADSSSDSKTSSA
jgi:hypothetical protein